ncbi:LysR family transcriptional regulator [Anaerovoracaceae bacterium 42-11]
MDLKKYEVLLKVVDRGSINNVSYDLGYTHSGISKMLNSMETELGFPIIKRSNKGITLTSEGERLMPMIRRIVKESEQLETEIALINGLEKGTIRIGSFPTTAYVLIPQILKKFCERYPNIQVEVLEEQSVDVLEQWLNRGIIDIGLFSRQSYHNFDWFGERKDEYVALVPKNHPLTGCEVVALEQLFKERVILFKSHKGFDQDIIQLMRYIDLNQHVGGYTFNSDFTVIRMVEENGFVTLVPKLIAEYAVSSFAVEYRPIDRELHRSIGFAVKSKNDISPSVKKFLSLVKEG